MERVQGYDVGPNTNRSSASGKDEDPRKRQNVSYTCSIKRIDCTDSRDSKKLLAGVAGRREEVSKHEA